MAGLGGFFGAALRYLISEMTSKSLGSFPLGTLIVNIVGSFLMGFLMEGSADLWNISAETRIFLTTGILGGLTTFSTFSYETVSFLSEGKLLMGGLNAALNLFLALLACSAGEAAVRMLKGTPIL